MNKNLEVETKIKILVLLGVICVSFSAVIIKSSHAPALIIAGYRMGFSTLLLMIGRILYFKKKEENLDGKTILLSMLSGICLALHFATWTTSIKYTSVASSTVLVDTQPIFVLLGSSVFLKEKIDKKVVGFMSLALIGSVIISLGDFSLGEDALYGDALALLGAIFIAGYMILGRVIRKHLSVMTYTLIVYGMSSITLLGLSVLSKIPLTGYSTDEILKFFLLALVCTLLGHSIFNWALAYIKPTFVSTSTLGEAVFASIWAWIYLSEVPLYWQIAGSSLVLYAIYRFITFKPIKSSKA